MMGQAPYNMRSKQNDANLRQYLSAQKFDFSEKSNFF